MGQSPQQSRTALTVHFSLRKPKDDAIHNILGFLDILTIILLYSALAALSNSKTLA